MLNFMYFGTNYFSIPTHSAAPCPGPRAQETTRGSGCSAEGKGLLPRPCHRLCQAASREAGTQPEDQNVYLQFLAHSRLWTDLTWITGAPSTALRVRAFLWHKDILLSDS